MGRIVKALPPDRFAVHGTNAEMRWDAMRGAGLLVPNDRFFVRDHTRTPLIDARTWRLRLFGDGLRGAPTRARAVEFGYADLLAMPSRTLDAVIECAGNGRALFASQQDTPMPGIPWGLGGIGAARWRGVPLAAVLERAGLRADAVDVLASGLDPDFVLDGENLGRVRRPLPVGKALDDVLIAYEMNGVPLPPDHGFPARLVVPGWVGIASIKWLGEIEVARRPLPSPWTTRMYRMSGPGHPPGGGPALTEQVAKSAFELAWDERVPLGRPVVLTGRSWSPRGPVHGVEVSVDGGASWRPARLRDGDTAWSRWSLEWCPDRTGPVVLAARAVDATGARQPVRSEPNDDGYLFAAAVHHRVQVT
ncbi:sulfite oxidase [Actinomadura sp. CNU-125]|uniref:sulfite oxidase n=1 Tax=Actinomadura sp. CNU-125 TaxID=1904961 RepID=UPI0009692590|nr:sulfite oxidase [Actinomadura sp. CNU-125]OLT34664.1 sulfite oxidase [Actinomadura sp. CNU-125]